MADSVKEIPVIPLCIDLVMEKLSSQSIFTWVQKLLVAKAWVLGGNTVSQDKVLLCVGEPISDIPEQLFRAYPAK